MPQSVKTNFLFENILKQHVEDIYTCIHGLDFIPFSQFECMYYIHIFTFPPLMGAVDTTVDGACIE